MAGKEKSRGELLTEQQNPSTKDIDSKTVTEILELINREDQAVAEKVAAAIPDISKAVELTTAAIRNGHRVFYIGAGTSGRLGVLDASEMPPTFSTPPNWFNGIIAGGDDALRKSIEGAEDQPENANKDLQAWGLEKGDVVIGISTSGAAAYVQRAIDYGREQGCGTCYILCTPVPYYEADADVVIKVETGPEVITGSTRMKAGTATKLVLNMISTATMIQLGKVYGNLMVDLMAVNEKLLDRGTRIIQQLTGLAYDEAEKALLAADKSVKNAVIMVKKECSLQQAESLLAAENGFLRNILE
ncbi:MAG TPA: N-acetylmuramic acid 6-phosphate etherase [Candidatus Marinimicrobia bacterium]|jgi:N-acetylmuramic acid 6-phosphate etherase|nr:N-acetylmuramic acid 6-phosphate etherase [Candidatus Neomarinimicrobiota bacterium]|tara:strand:- start:2386 stop:3291 length:906 start_codon:yes stop_codon:yes gene_type:complete